MESFFVENVLSKIEIQEILDIFSNNHEYHISIVKNNKSWIRLPLMPEAQLPYRSNIRVFVNRIVKKIFDIDLSNDVHFGDNIFKTSGVYGPHVDNEMYKDKKIWKQILVPLYVDSGYTKFFTFNELWSKGRASFRYNQAKPEYLVNNVITEKYTSNSQFIKINKDTVDIEWYKNNINLPDKLPFEIFTDLSLEKEFNYIPGNVIVFDSRRIHCGHNLNLSGASYKIGMSITIFI